MPKTESFEQHSAAYDEWFEKNHAVYAAELEVIRQLLPSAEAKGVEVGVGSGRFAAPLGIKIGVEPSEKMAALARKRGIRVVPGTAEDLPFPDNSFDFVLMVTTLCFVDDVAQSFREAFRVLKSEGCVIIGFVDKESPLGRQYAQRGEKSKFYREASFYSAPDVLKSLEEAGFKTMEIKQTLISEVGPQIILSGFGEGAFVAIKGAKKSGE
ncbi:MAG: class I SAM-dependent methyltransferase [Desulfuromonadaceae bacterium]|nr:class I SAM-dependent methyltransferase [Desulfuromonas sp.]MDY0184289.1 class I SAM-dependent methyltransferase [Desulfuromonadaceae bacterium]